MNVLALLLAASLVGCSAPATNAVVGIVVAVDGEGLGEVRGFTLRTDTGNLIAFEVGAVALNDGAFPPDHLREHMAAASPVLVAFRTEDGRHIAIRLEDAPVSTSP